MSKISEVTDLKLGDTEELASQIEVTRVENDETETSLKIKLGMSLAEVEKLLILQTLKSVNGSQKKAAEILGVSTRTLRNKLNEYKQLTSDLSKAPNS
jgi:DNA-binding NtrC family response regulator